MSRIVRTQRQTVIVPGRPVGPPGATGAPGGNIMAIGLFTAASGLTIAGGTNIVRTSGYSTDGVGIADYVYDAAVDAAYVTAHPRTSFRDAAGRGFRLASRIFTPAMVGHKPYKPSAEVFDTDAMRAYFDAAKDPQFCRERVFDWRGEWGVDDKVYACYNDAGGGVAVDASVERNFIPGTLRFKTGGTYLNDYVLEIAGVRQTWIGTPAVHPAGLNNYGVGYYSRPYRGAIRVRCASFSVFLGGFRADNARRDAIDIDSRESGGFTVNGVSFPYASNIGAYFGPIAGRYNGSCPLQSDQATPLTVSAAVYGGWSGGGSYSSGEAFTAGDYANSSNQRTKLTVSSTADLEILDPVWSRLELTPSIYGTIAANSGAKTITWTAGDPTNIDGSGHGLNVGDLYPYFQAGPNAGVEFRIVSFGGTSNRTITVDRAPATHSATSDPTYKQYGKPSWHLVSRVIDATTVVISGYLPQRNNSSLYIAHGGTVRTRGVDEANINIATIEGLGCGCAYRSEALYAAKVGTLLGEGSEIGAIVGFPDGLNTGNKIDHGHVEANRLDIWQIGLPTGNVNLSSNYDLSKILVMGTRSSTNIQSEASTPLKLVIETGIANLESRGHGINEGFAFQTETFGVSNGFNDNYPPAHADTINIPVTFDEQSARLFPNSNRAQIIWTGTNGDAPTGTATFTLDPILVARGWSFAGAGSGSSYALTAPGLNILFLFEWLAGPKKVAVTIAGVAPGQTIKPANVDVSAAYKIGGTTVLNGQMAHQADSAASDVATLKTDFNALLAKLQGVKLMA